MTGTTSGAENEYRVFGPPGTGKTTFLSRQIKRAAESRGSQDIIVASFTRAAAETLIGRDLPIDRRQVSTLHAHGYRAIGHRDVADAKTSEWNRWLADNHYPPSYALTPERGGGGADRMIDRSIEGNFQTDGDKTYMALQTARAQMIDPQRYPDTLREFATLWATWKRETGYVDFTDMIELALRDVDAAPGNPSVGFFDEVQDFTPLELALVRKWGRRMDTVLLAGDDDQCIYGFKGAEPESFLNPPLPDANIRVLGQSYRVPRAVKDYAQAWIEQLAVRQPKAYAPKIGDDGEVVEGELRRAPFNYMQADPLIADMEQHIAAGKTVMVLATCGFMLDNIKRALRAAGVPFHNPYARSRGDWNPLRPARGVSASERLLAFLRPDPATWGEDARMWHAEDIRKVVDALLSKPTLRHGAKAQMERYYASGEVPVETLAAWLTEPAFAALWDADLNWLRDNLLAAKRETMMFPIRVVEARGGAALRSDPLVTIGTIHSVKGGESDVVYMFPDLSRPGAMAQETAAGRDAIVRQMYVGMTRAAETLVICQPVSTMRAKGV